MVAMPRIDEAETARLQLLAYGEQYLQGHPRLLEFWRLEYGGENLTNAELADILDVDERTVRKQRRQARLAVANGDARDRQELLLLKEGDVFNSLTIVRNGDVGEVADNTMGQATGIRSRRSGGGRLKETLRPDDW